eukprot:347862-Chlamydomonas_euryale.AAC.1
MAAAFNLGNVSGGRRPRSVAALRVKDCAVVAQVVTNLDGPVLSIFFTDEKYMDSRGVRSVPENFSGLNDTYLEAMRLSASYFLYAAFVARGVFCGRFPLKGAAHGQVLAPSAGVGH